MQIAHQSLYAISNIGLYVLMLDYDARMAVTLGQMHHINDSKALPVI